MQSVECIGGEGTYLHQGKYICASLVGRVVKERVGGDVDCVVVRVAPVEEGEEGAERRPIIPKEGDVVVGRVIRVSKKQAYVDILSVNEAHVKETFSGVLRSQDVRRSDIDTLELNHCFRSKDIVRARILSLGDSKWYYLTTCDLDLGVIAATSQASGKPMVPMDEKTMQCADTKETEARKVAIITK